jgi:hypothetical protein
MIARHMRRAVVVITVAVMDRVTLNLYWPGNWQPWSRTTLTQASLFLFPAIWRGILFVLWLMVVSQLLRPLAERCYGLPLNPVPNEDRLEGNGDV